MLRCSAEANHLPRVAEFYHGKSVFVTGAAGFVGSILLETLLRCCSGIKSIYILLRSKKNIQPEVRKEQIFSKKIFEKLKEENPELFDKVHVIPGDVSLPNLGMNGEDTQLLLEEVSVVFHCAAIINFTKPLEFMLINNVVSVNSVIELCKKMRKLEALVYTSTAYSNSNHKNVSLKEEVYRLPFRAEKFLDALKNKDSEKLQELVTQCKPDWPNTYTFSKCLAENVIMDTASNLPIVIIRPSIVFSTWKHPIPGYLEENSGIMALSLGAGKGFIKVLHGDPNCKLNLVPVDIVANAHLVAAWSVGTKRCVSPLVVNCTATEKLHVKLSEYNETMTELSLKYPLPLSYEQNTNLIIVPYKGLYYIVSAYQHYLLAIFLDGIRKMLGKKTRVLSLYRFYDTVMFSMNFFLFHCFEFERKNVEYLDKLIHPEDRKTNMFPKLTYIPQAVDFDETNMLILENEIEYIPDEETQLTLGETVIKLPRKMAGYGQEGLTVLQTGYHIKSKPWTPMLLKLKKIADHHLPEWQHFNFALVEKYENELDRKEKHEEDDAELDIDNPQIMFTFGATRRIVFKNEKEQEKSIDVKDGSMLLYKPPTRQREIPKQLGVFKPTITVTFKKFTKCEEIDQNLL